LREKVEISRLIAAAPRRAAVVERETSASFFDRLFGGMPRFVYGLAAAAVLLGVVALSFLIFQDNKGQEVSIAVPAASDKPPGSNSIPTHSPEPSAVPANDQQPAPPTPETQPVARQSATPTDRVPRTPSVIALTLAPPTRASNQIRTIRIQPGVRYLDLNVQTEADPDGKLRVEIGDAASDNVEWRSAAMTPVSRNGRVSVKVRLPVEKLGSGLRSVRLRETNGDGAILDEHAIRIIR
jgi:hypothetical protein